MITQHLTQKKAITLSELMIAMVIVGIIMLGVVSADYAIQKFYTNSSKGAVSGFNAIAMMDNITAVALTATGTMADPGIQVDSTILDNSGGGTGYTIGNNTFCIRSQVNPWQCYTTIAANGTTTYLYNCTKANPANCADTDTKIAQITSMTAKFVLVPTQGTQSLLFTFTLTVPDTDTTTKTYSTSVTPPNHRL